MQGTTRAVNMTRDHLPRIEPEDIDVSMVPLEMQEAIRALIVQKAEARIANELRQLKDMAMYESTVMRGHLDQRAQEDKEAKEAYDRFVQDQQEYYKQMWTAWENNIEVTNPAVEKGKFNKYGYNYPFAHPNGGAPYFGGYPGHYPYQPWHPGYGHLPAGLSKEDEDEYVKKFLKSQERQSPSRNTSPARRSPPRGGSSPGRSSYARTSGVDLPLGAELSPARLRRYKIVDPAEWEARQAKQNARDRAKAYDQSIKHDILYCGREGSMNITYDPYHHGPFHPYHQGPVYGGYQPTDEQHSLIAQGDEAGNENGSSSPGRRTKSPSRGTSPRRRGPRSSPGKRR